MEAIRNLLTALPAPVALVLMLGGFVFYALGCIRLGYGAAVKPTVLQLIEQAEKDIQGTKKRRGAKSLGGSDAPRGPGFKQVRKIHLVGHHR